MEWVKHIFGVFCARASIKVLINKQRISDRTVAAVLPIIFLSFIFAFGNLSNAEINTRNVAKHYIQKPVIRRFRSDLTRSLLKVKSQLDHRQCISYGPYTYGLMHPWTIWAVLEGDAQSQNPVVSSELEKKNVTLRCDPDPPDETLLSVKWYLDGDLLKELPECGYRWVVDIEGKKLEEADTYKNAPKSYVNPLQPKKFFSTPI